MIKHLRCTLTGDVKSSSGTTIKYLRGSAGARLGTTIKYLRRTTSGAAEFDTRYPNRSDPPLLVSPPHTHEPRDLLLCRDLSVLKNRFTKGEVQYNWRSYLTEISVIW
jgi:hypothetical protein